MSLASLGGEKHMRDRFPPHAHRTCCLRLHSVHAPPFPFSAPRMTLMLCDDAYHDRDFMLRTVRGRGRPSGQKPPGRRSDTTRQHIMCVYSIIVLKFPAPEIRMEFGEFRARGLPGGITKHSNGDNCSLTDKVRKNSTDKRSFSVHE